MNNFPPCPRCNGAGFARIGDDEIQCEQCYGTGLLTGVVEVRLSPEMQASGVYMQPPSRDVLISTIRTLKATLKKIVTEFEIAKEERLRPATQTKSDYNSGFIVGFSSAFYLANIAYEALQDLNPPTSEGWNAPKDT